MKRLILATVISFFAMSSNGTVTTTDNPFYNAVEVNHPLFAKGAGGSQCKGLHRVFVVRWLVVNKPSKRSNAVIPD
jgi:hypothetical protein